MVRSVSKGACAPVLGLKQMLALGVSGVALAAATPGLAQVQPSPSATKPPVAVEKGTEALATAPPQNADVAPNAADSAAPPSAAPVGAPGAGVAEVVVTGVRASLQSAQAIKQRSDVIVDSISAEDIGALPDRSVTEALQRVPGVSIDRFAAANDPDHFSVEGSGVTIRGLTYSRSEFNGRDAFTANNGRGLNFQDVPSELLGGVDVFKSQSADMIEGGIAGTVNLRTRLPFDARGPVIAGSLEGSYGDMVNRAAPTFSVLGSDRWSTPWGDFGILANFVTSEIRTRADAIQLANYGARTLYDNGNVVPNDPGQPVANAVGQVYVPRGADMREDVYDRTRVGYGGAVQWRSPDHTMQATLQYLRSEAKEAWTEHAIEIATDNVTANYPDGQSTLVPDSRGALGSTLAFDSNGVLTNGILTGGTGYRADNGTTMPQDIRTPIYGLEANNQRRDVLSDNVTNDLGFNFKWTPNSRFSVNLDVQHTTATVDDLDVTLWTASYQNVGFNVHGSEDLPSISFLPPGRSTTVANCPATGTPSTGLYSTAAAYMPGCPSYYSGTHQSFSDPYNYFPRNAMDHIEQSEGEENAVRLDLDYNFGDHDDWFKGIRAGYRFSDRDETTRFSTYNWGVITEQWGGTGPVWLTDPVDGVPPPSGAAYDTAGQSVANRFETFAFNDFLRGQTQNPTGDQPHVFYAGNAQSGYADLTALALKVGDEWRARYNPSTGLPQNWVPLASRPGVVAGTPFLPAEINPVDEQTHSGYLMFRYGHDLWSNWNLSGNFGVRYTRTNRVAQGYYYFNSQSVPNGQTCISDTGEATQAFCLNTTPEVRAQAQAFLNGALVPNNADFTYDNWLPSFNANLKWGGNKIFRLGIYEAITPPPIGYTRDYFNISLNTTDVRYIVNGRPTGFFTTGNPLLKPISADNFDFSAEWYFAKVGQLSFAAFYKRLHDVVTNGTQRESFTNNGATFDAVVTTPYNSPDVGEVEGFEIGYQQVYSFLPGLLRGLGLNANYTYVDSSGVAQTTLSATDPDVGAGLVANVDTSKLPLQGLSNHTVNLQPFYELGPVSLRLAWNWRSKYLLTPRDVIVPYAPIFAEAQGQLDASAFYALTPHVKIGFQGVNLLNEVTRTSQVINNDLLTAPRSWFMNDRRYTLILRANF